MRIIQCDKCKKDISDISKFEYICKKGFPFDLCKKCNNKLEEWFYDT